MLKSSNRANRWGSVVAVPDDNDNTVVDVPDTDVDNDGGEGPNEEAAEAGGLTSRVELHAEAARGEARSAAARRDRGSLVAAP